MKNIKTITAYEAVEALVEGIKICDKNPDFKIDMSTFGETSSEGNCRGCASTAALQVLTGRFFTWIELSSVIDRTNACKEIVPILGDTSNWFTRFESVLDLFRLGTYVNTEYRFLFHDFFNINRIKLTKMTWSLNNFNYMDELPKVEKWLEANKYVLKKGKPS